MTPKKTSKAVTSKRGPKKKTAAKGKALTKAKKGTASKAAATASKKPAGRDVFGGRIGTRMSAINLVVIEAGKHGATVHEVAKKTGETTGVVSAQLGWMVSHKKVATRKEEKGENGRKTFRYFAKEQA